ncbi:MAG: hypothetical protein ABIR34_09225 [Marmoricola sp.]
MRSQERDDEKTVQTFIALLLFVGVAGAGSLLVSLVSLVEPVVSMDGLLGSVVVDAVWALAVTVSGGYLFRHRHRHRHGHRRP